MLMRNRVAIVVLAAGATLTLSTSAAFGQMDEKGIQRLRDQLKQPVSTASSLQDRLFVRSKTRNWVLTAELRVPQPRTASREIKDTDYFNPNLPGTLVNPLNPGQPLKNNQNTMTFNSVSVYFPIPEKTAGHEFQARTFDAKILTDDVEAFHNTSDNMMGFVSGREGSRFAQWLLPNGVFSRFNLTVKIPQVCSSLVMDDALADSIPWPIAGRGWSGDAKSALEPLYLVDFVQDRKEIQETQAKIDKLLKKWLNARDPKALTPVQLAREVTGQVMSEFRTINDSVISGEGGYIAGFRFQSAGTTIDEGRGTEAQLAQLLTAILRRLDIPARTVFGLELEDRRKDELGGRNSRTKQRAWIEFAVMDAATGAAVWIPVDMKRQRDSSSRPPASGRGWRFFGNHEDMEYMLPIAFHMHPPIDAGVRGLPAFWGWNAPGGVPQVFHGLRFDVSSQNSRQREENDPKPKKTR